jgi:hypothetical protein
MTMVIKTPIPNTHFSCPKYFALVSCILSSCFLFQSSIFACAILLSTRDPESRSIISKRLNFGVSTLIFATSRFRTCSINQIDEKVNTASNDSPVRMPLSFNGTESIARMTLTVSRKMVLLMIFILAYERVE